MIMLKLMLMLMMMGMVKEGKRVCRSLLPEIISYYPTHYPNSAISA